MRSNSQRLMLAAALVVASTLAAACSSSGGSADGGGSAATTVATTSTSALEATTTTAAGEDVELADGRLLVPAANVGDVDLTALPVGDDLVTLDTPTVGGLDLCSTFPTNGQGTPTQGPWFNGDGTWDLTAKVAVLGEVDWPEAEFATSIAGEDRSLTGNNLPVDTQTGTFPIAADDPAAAFDPNPASIFANEYDITIPANPTEADAPTCVAGEVGYLLNGVILNSPVDALGRDAVAWEEQDPCEGHPNGAVGYHFHSVSPCIPDEGTGHSDLVGYALDGFGIYGHRGGGGAVLTSADLDECHGHVGEVEWDGQTVEMYHYHATWDFPYAVGCFHGTNSVQGPGGGPPGP